MYMAKMKSEVNGLQQEQKTIAKQLMDSYFQSIPRRNWMHKTAKSDHKPGETMVLYFISRLTQGDRPGVMVSEISEKLNLTSPTITQHINSLEAQGLVRRQDDPDDRRVVRIRLTEAGNQYIQRIDEARLQMFVELVKHLGEEESVRFAATMRKASEFIHRQQGHCPQRADDHHEDQ